MQWQIKDTHCYLIPTSCHKSHVLKNIPYGVARRVRQNNSENTNFLEQKEVFTQYLLDQGYHSSLIKNAFNKFSDLANRKDPNSLKEKNDKNTCLLPMAIDQNPAFPNMGSIIHRYKHLHKPDPALKKLFVSNRKNRTIGDMLVHNIYRPSGSQSRDAERETTAYQIPEADPLPIVAVHSTMPVVNAMFVSKISCPPVFNLVAIILNRSSLF